MTTVTAMSRALAAGETTSARLVAAAIDRARQPDSAAVLLTVTAERARYQADAADRRRLRDARRGPLDGIPIAWKDVFDVQGTVTTSGSAAHQHDAPAAVDGRLVRRAHDAGLVTIGKTNLSEFAFSGLGINSHFGTPANPIDPLSIPGGSSSGSAVAVARGIVPLAVGTDTSGSVRVPAAYCGVIGYRASPGRYGPNDFAPLSATLDSVGIFATEVHDIIALDRVFAPARREEQLSPRRFVVPEGEWTADLAPGIAADFAAALAEIRSAGADIRVRRLESLHAAQALMDRAGTIVGAEAYLLHRHRLDSSLPIESATRRRLESNSSTADSIAPVYARMSALREQFAAELEGATLLCPTVRRPPPHLADLRDPAAYDGANAAVLRTTMLLSYLGSCGISLPVGTSAGGLLLSLPSGCDVELLAHADWLCAIPWAG
ncbi:amidase family protein [Nocardia sp. CDC153]|uniref:amidase family protein n=1 Tax=Nocardia sp. CDC153 TaxID=3112167 RepID=UPI002DBC4956|nr:amidase family protein [Nocardia sp. CDC153]MEC3954658.1 amidase family protein [Nocardia sp. CDC153]